MIVYQVSAKFNYLYTINWHFQIKASQADCDALKHQVQLLMESMAISPEDAEEILSTDILDKVITN